MEKCKINSAIDHHKIFLDSQLKLQQVIDNGSSKMNLQEIKLLDITTEYEVVLRELQFSDLKSSSGWMLELILCADKRVFSATTSRGNVRIFKTLETALAYALDACKNRKSLHLYYHDQKLKVTTEKED